MGSPHVEYAKEDSADNDGGQDESGADRNTDEHGVVVTGRAGLGHRRLTVWTGSDVHRRVERLYTTSP